MLDLPTDNLQCLASDEKERDRRKEKEKVIKQRNKAKRLRERKRVREAVWRHAGTSVITGSVSRRKELMLSAC